MAQKWAIILLYDCARMRQWRQDMRLDNQISIKFTAFEVS